MFIKLLLSLLLGYVRIEVEGYYVERFINICTNRKIFIWNLKRDKGVKLCLNIGINDFKNISQIAKKSSCRVRILKKKGLPFLLNRYKKRKFFAILLVLILGCIYLSSTYVWNIEIKVEDNMQIENIEEDLQTAGLTRGMPKKKINADKIINDLRLKRNDIAWVGIDVKGTNIMVNIVKAEESPEIIDNSEYCDIVATKNGTITKITAQNGTKLVNVGDEVSQGDILIAGYMDGKYTDRRYVHSLGEVEAKVLYEESEEVKLNSDNYIETGNVENKYEISFNKFRIKLYKNISKFDIYESQKTKQNLRIFENFYLPISIIKITNKEQLKEEQNYTIEDAIQVGTKDLSEILDNKIESKDKIVNKIVNTEETPNSVIITLCYEVLETIGKSQKIN